jgi:hypothetical protein
MLLIHTAEQLVKEYGIVASLISKPARSLDPEGAYTVEKAYYNDTSSQLTTFLKINFRFSFNLIIKLVLT